MISGHKVAGHNPSICEQLSDTIFYACCLRYLRSIKSGKERFTSSISIDWGLR